MEGGVESFTNGFHLGDAETSECASCLQPPCVALCEDSRLSAGEPALEVVFNREQFPRQAFMAKPYEI